MTNVVGAIISGLAASISRILAYLLLLSLALVIGSLTGSTMYGQLFLISLCFIVIVLDLLFGVFGGWILVKKYNEHSSTAVGIMALTGASVLFFLGILFLLFFSHLVPSLLIGESVDHNDNPAASISKSLENISSVLMLTQVFLGTVYYFIMFLVGGFIGVRLVKFNVTQQKEKPDDPLAEEKEEEPEPEPAEESETEEPIREESPEDPSDSWFVGPEDKEIEKAPKSEKAKPKKKSKKPGKKKADFSWDEW